MTALADAVDAVDDARPRPAPPDALATPAGGTPSAPPWTARRATIIMVTAVAALVISIVAFQGPVGHVWYQSRQQNLAGDLNAKRPRSHKGQALAVLQIPKIDVNLVLVEGDGPRELRGGPGHRIGTPLPGETGNSLIFAHRSGWGAPFSKLGQLVTNDPIVVKMRGQPQAAVFTVTAVTHVASSDVHLFLPSDDYRITLVTATGGRFSNERLVVTAISGDQGKLRPATARVAATSSYQSKILNTTVVIFVLLVLALIVAIKQLGIRHGIVITSIVVAPLALGALLALFLELDLAILPPLH